MNRRDFLKILVSLPILGALALFVSPLFRYLRPTSGPLSSTHIAIEQNGKKQPVTNWQGDRGLFSQPDMPTREKDVVFNLADFPTRWSSRAFTFGQQSKEYTFRNFQVSKIPGFAVRLSEGPPTKPEDFIIVNRICPHMGCVFNYLDNPADAAAYNYPVAKNPLFACPCHLSVYDPLQTQDVEGKTLRGRVVSGPAPRPPRQFSCKVDGPKLVITELEAGGIA